MVAARASHGVQCMRERKLVPTPFRDGRENEQLCLRWGGCGDVNVDIQRDANAKQHQAAAFPVFGLFNEKLPA